MDENEFQKLENFIQGKLTTLPNRKAPVDLTANVFARIARQESKWWWQRPFNYWPKPAQFCLHATLALSFVLFIYLGTILFGHISAGTASASTQITALGNEVVGFFVNCGKICWAVLSRASWDSLAILATLLAIAYFGCVGLGVALYKVAFRNLQTT